MNYSPEDTCIENLLARKDGYTLPTAGPLSGCSVLVTRPDAQVQELRDLLEKSGAKVKALPLIEIVPDPDQSRIKNILQNIALYDWLVFSSVNGVNYFSQAVARYHIDLEVFKNIHLAAIGPKTAGRLAASGFGTSFVPSRYCQETMAEELASRIENPRKTRVLTINARESRDILINHLRKIGVRVERIFLYQAQLANTGTADRLNYLLANHEVDAVTLTSSSCVKAFASMTGDVSGLKNIIIAVLGPVCAATAQQLGLKVDVMPSSYTIEALTASLCDYYTRNSKGYKV